MPTYTIKPVLVATSIKLVGSSRNRQFWSMCIRKKMARHAKTQPLFQLMSLLKIHNILNNGIFIAYEYFLRKPNSVTPMWLYLSIKDFKLEILDQFNLLQKSSTKYQKICLCNKHQTFRRIKVRIFEVLLYSWSHFICYQ